LPQSKERISINNLMSPERTYRSLKPRKKCVMRHKIYDIYKALRHFGVSETEIDEIAPAYKTWLKDPIETVSPYGTVYYHDGMLYSMPYPVSGLSAKVVGIEINGVIYLNGYVHNVLKDEVANSLMWLQGQVFNHLSYKRNGIEMPNTFKLELPTAKEAKLLYDKVYADRNTKVCNKMGDFWITPDEAKPEKSVISIQLLKTTTHKPKSEDTKATVYAVIHKNSHVFIGKLDNYGMLSKSTAKVYKLLQEVVK